MAQHRILIFCLALIVALGGALGGLVWARRGTNGASVVVTPQKTLDGLAQPEGHDSAAAPGAALGPSGGSAQVKEGENNVGTPVPPQQDPTATAAPAGTDDGGPGFSVWRAAAGGFAGWQRQGTAVAPNGALTIDAASAQPGTDPYPAGEYFGHSFYNGGSFAVGEATSPVVSAASFSEAIASWNADTPAGTWIETQVRARLGDHWTKWYNLGVWAADSSTIERHSVQRQGDADGEVTVDTLALAGKASASAYQVKLRLFTAQAGVTPAVRNVSVATSAAAARQKALAPGNPALWNQSLAVPACSQMIYQGGDVWCSATSTSMIVGYWDHDTGSCEPRVRAAVAGIYDWAYDGTGNWPFNAAYAATHGLEAYVARFSSLAEAERWVDAGVPVAITVSWKQGDLTGAAVPSSEGHLMVLVGFDEAGNPIVNDPAAPSDAGVRRTYDRAELESLWLESSRGTVYLIYPPGAAVPSLP